MLVSAPSLSVEAISDANGLEDLRQEWSALWDCCPTATCFQTPEWTLPWVKQFFRGEKILSFALRQEERLVGLAPFLRAPIL